MLHIIIYTLLFYWNKWCRISMGNVNLVRWVQGMHWWILHLPWMSNPLPYPKTAMPCPLITLSPKPTPTPPHDPHHFSLMTYYPGLHHLKQILGKSLCILFSDSSPRTFSPNHPPSLLTPPVCINSTPVNLPPPPIPQNRPQCTMCPIHNPVNCFPSSTTSLTYLSPPMQTASFLISFIYSYVLSLMIFTLEKYTDPFLTI